MYSGCLGQRPKTNLSKIVHVGKNPKKNPPFVNMTLSSTWHAVYYYIVIMNILLPIITM